MAARRTRTPKTDNPAPEPAPKPAAKDPLKDILAIARSPKDPSQKIHEILRYCGG